MENPVEKNTLKKYIHKETFEKIALGVILSFVVINAIILKDNPVALINAVCGILYTLLAGKGKTICYYFGLLGSGCYALLSFKNMLFGNLLLYLFYYIPMQILGIFLWKKNLKEDKSEIIKIRLNNKERIKVFFIGLLGSLLTILILYQFQDKNPILDGITTFLSILGMYLTVKRAIEQWFVWMIVNGLSFLMWINVVMGGTKAYSTVIMWGVYFAASFYFYFMWKKELDLK